jgi:hypothetical protein
MKRNLTIGFAGLPKDWEGPLFMVFALYSTHVRTVRYRAVIDECVFDFYAPRFMLPGLVGDAPPTTIVVALDRADGPVRSLGFRGAPLGLQTDPEIAEYRAFEKKVNSIRYRTAFEKNFFDLYVPKALFKGEKAPRRLCLQIDGIRFRLRFPIREMRARAAAYDYGDDIPERIGAEARAAGFYTKDQFLAMCEWKSQRPRARFETNADQFVEEATRVALQSCDERLRIGNLRLLDGVDYPTASVLLHFGHPDPYPILDVRALWSLGLDELPSSYSFDFWWAYVECCRRLATLSGLTMRDVDRALWTYSKQNQPA